MLKKYLFSLSQERESGQTSVEYILMLAVLVVIITSIMGSIQERLIGETPCADTDNSLGCTITRSISSFGATGEGFRYFQLRY